MKKGIKTLLLMMTMILAWKGGTINAAAQSDLAEGVQPIYQSDYEKPTVVTVDDEQNILGEHEEYQQELRLQPESSYYALSAEEYNWNKYSTDYYYKQLTTDEKKLWDTLDDICYSYLTTQMDAYVDSGQSARTPFINAEELGVSLTKQQIINVEWLFLYSNPQFYFLNDFQIFTSNNWTALGIYSEFADGIEREYYTEVFKNQTESWINDIESAGTTPFEKELEGHDLICDEVSYELSDFDQSAYSAIVNKTTVCAGYTKAYILLMNGVGIDTVPITGPGHAWTEVCLDGNWYVVDPTWDDQAYAIIYDLFNATYEQVKQRTQMENSHTPDSFLQNMMPKCEKEYSSTVRAYRCVAPKITVNENTATLSYKNNYTTYYTLDGSVPTTNSLKYVDPFSVANTRTIQAVSVGRFTPSRVVRVNMPRTYSIIYHLNGGTNHAGNPNSVALSDDKLALRSPTRKGYTFAGWYTEPGFVNKVTSVGQSNTSSVNLYAKWTANKYNIAFIGNYSTNIIDMADISDCQYDQSYTLSANVFKCTGYTFAGWNTKIDGSGTSYADRASVKNLSATDGETVRLYAQWKLSAVSGLKAENNGYGKVKLTWSKSTNVAGYIIYKKNNSTGKFEYYTMTSNTSYTDTKASAANYSFYRVYPYRLTSDSTREIGLSDAYVYAKGTPVAVTNLKAASAGKEKVTLTWTKTSEAVGYIIYKKNNATGKFEYLYMTSGASYTDSSASGLDYNFYRVYPYVKDSSGKRVLGASDTYVYAKGVLAAPKNVKVVKPAAGQAKLTWDKVSGAAGYIIYRKTGGGTFTYLSMSSTTSFTDKAAVSGIYNFYRIYAYYIDGSGKRVLSGNSDYVYMKP